MDPGLDYQDVVPTQKADPDKVSGSGNGFGPGSKNVEDPTDQWTAIVWKKKFKW